MRSICLLLLLASVAPAADNELTAKEKSDGWQLLFDGKSVKDAACDLRITEGSARQYLKKVFEKTGAKRQLDLIRVIEGALARNG